MTTTPTPEQPNTTAAVLIDAAELAQLRKDAADTVAARGEAAHLRAQVAVGEQAQADLTRRRHEELVNNAIKAGKFGPARRAGWLKALEIDEPGTVADIDSIPAGLIPMQQIGDSGDALDSDDSLYNQAWTNRKDH